jgi:hypothetical protein
MNDPKDMLDIIHMHQNWYPQMEFRDVYKLIFQGTMGGEHLISSPQGFINYLKDEYAPLVADPNERLLEPIRPDGALFRINLRPYKAFQMNVDALIEPLLSSAQAFSGDSANLRATWSGFVQACERGDITISDVAGITQFTTWLEGLGFPAVHHSEIYSREYQPAYRLISAQFLHQLGLANAG